MDAYIYQADLLCSRCTGSIMLHLKTPEGWPDERTYDSDDYPKGPYANGGGEADFPQHCWRCGVFLENPLTEDGEQYVREAIAAAEENGKMDVYGEWKQFYSYLFRGE